MKLLCISLILFSLSIFSSAQDYEPSVDFAGLMNMRFYNESGGFMVETLPMLFPPSNDTQIKLEITTGDGEVKYQTDLRLQRWDNLKVFAGLTANGPGIVHLKQTGDFIINIKVDGKTVSRLPFKMVVEKGDDPYNPTTTYMREGPWENLAYFSYEPDRPDYNLKFNWWTCLRELPGKNKGAKVTVHILKGDSEIARSQSSVIVSYKNWQPFSYNMVLPDKKETNPFTINSLTKENGKYSVVLKTDGKVFKTYDFIVTGGKIEELPQNNLEYSPHYDFIAQRVLDISSGSNSSYKVLQVNWVHKK